MLQSCSRPKFGSRLEKDLAGGLTWCLGELWALVFGSWKSLCEQIL